MMYADCETVEAPRERLVHRFIFILERDLHHYDRSGDVVDCGGTTVFSGVHNFRPKKKQNHQVEREKTERKEVNL